jgi:hypothetical protein
VRSSKPDWKPTDTHLLRWLGSEDTSAYGECAGPSFDRLAAAGLVRRVKSGRIPDLDRVSLTEAGWRELKKLGGKNG